MIFALSVLAIWLLIFHISKYNRKNLKDEFMRQWEESNPEEARMYRAAVARNKGRKPKRLVKKRLPRMKTRKVIRQKPMKKLPRRRR